MKKLAAILALVLALTLGGAALAETQLIAIPNDGTNMSRGIKLLETAGFLEVDPAAGYVPEIKDITKYLYDIEVMPVDANTLTSTLKDYAAATINGTFAVPYGLVPSRDGLIVEKQSEAGDNPYVNIIVARTADAENEIYQKVVAAYRTQLVAQILIEDTKEAWIPVFDYEPYTVEEGWLEEMKAYESDSADKTVVKVGVVGANNSMWKAVQKVLDEQGEKIYIELVEFDKYDLPNEALNSGEIDLNAFQHKAFLNKEIRDKGFELTVIGDTLIAPLTLYSEKYDSIDAIKEAAGELK